MPDELDRMFTAVRIQADTAVLPEPATARRIGTRRRVVRFVAAATALTVVVVGVGLAGARLLPHRAGPVPPAGPTAPPSTASPPSTPAPSTLPPSTLPPSTPAPSTPATGPGAVAPDPCQTDPAYCYPPKIPWHDERLPAPCATPSHPSDALLMTRRAGGRGTYRQKTGDLAFTEFFETLTRYRDDGAVRYLQEVRAAVRQCPSITRQDLPELGSRPTTIRYALGSTGFAGDESFLVRRTYPIQVQDERAPVEVTFLVAVVRVGNVVIVGYDHGWEGSPTPSQLFDEFVRQAVADARASAP